MKGKTVFNNTFRCLTSWDLMLNDNTVMVKNGGELMVNVENQGQPTRIGDIPTTKLFKHHIRTCVNGTSISINGG